MGVFVKGMTIEQLRRMGVAGIMLSEERLIEVPEPHGRLIDADKLIHEWIRRADGKPLNPNDAPTVIEAEE